MKSPCRRWFGLPIILTAALATGSALAGDTDGNQSGTSKPAPDFDKLAKDIQAVKDQGSQIKDSLKGMDDAIRKGMAAMANDIGSLKSDLDSIRATLKLAQDSQKTMQQAIDAWDAKFNDMSARVNGEFKRMQNDLDAIRKGPGADRRISAALPNDQQQMPPPPPLGTIRLQNNLDHETTFRLNGRTYRLLPGTTWVLDRHFAGPITYEVFGVQPQRTTYLYPNETLTLRAEIQ